MFGSFKLAPKGHQPPTVVARKCIVCGTTRHECHMRPFMLKGSQLNVWTNNYFAHKRQKLFNFYAKLRYTINPFACAEHFDVAAVTLPAPLEPTPSLPKLGKRNVAELLTEGEEPPSIQKIIEKKPSPPPEEVPAPRTEKEVTDAVMAILKTAKEEMDKEEKTRRMLRKITRKVNHGADGYDMRVKRRKKKRRRREQFEGGETGEKRVIDGNEADSDNSETIDVEAIDSDASGRSTSSGSSSCYSESDSDIEAVPHQPAPASGFTSSGMPRVYKPPRRVQPPMVLVPRRHFPPRAPYLIAAPQKPPSSSTSPFLDGRSLSRHPRMVPKRLTLERAGTGRTYMRPSWVAPNPGQMTLASVLQRFWNEDNQSVGERPPKQMGKMPFGRTVLPGTMTKFTPASVAAPALLRKRSNSPSDPPVHHPSIRTSALLLNNPPLSPSRLIVGGEETVETTQDSDSDSKTLVMSSSSESSSAESDMEVEVCDHSAAERPPVEGAKIEGELEEKSVRSRTVSTVLSTSSMASSEDEVGGESEVDVETVEETSDKNEDEEDTVDPMDTVDGRDTVSSPDGDLAEHMPFETSGRVDRRKQRMPSAGSRLYHRVLAMNRFILPPSAMVKPPTRLLSSGQYSMKDLLHAQARAAAGQPVRIDTTGLVYGAKRHMGLRPKGMPRLTIEKGGESEWARLERIVEQKMADHRAKKEMEKKKAQMEMVDKELMSENPPPELDRVETEDEAEEQKGEDGKTDGRKKVLRMRFKEKEEVDVSKMRVLDKSTRPKGVIREEVVVEAEEDDGPPTSPPKMEQMAVATTKKKRGLLFAKKPAHPTEVRNPVLIINKDELLEMKERLNVPPPTPVVGIPDEKELAARREMFQKKRKTTAVRAAMRFGHARRTAKAKDAWQRIKMMEEMGVLRRGMSNVNLLDEEEEEEEDEAVAQSLEIVRMVKAAKLRAMKIGEGMGGVRTEERKRVRTEEGEEEHREGMRKEGMEARNEGIEEGKRADEEEGEKRDEETMFMLSDIEHEEGNEERMEEEEGGREEDVKDDDEDYEDGMEEEGEGKRKKGKADEEWTMRGAGRVEKEDGETRRKSHRLRVKREALPKSERRLIWKGSDDDEEEEEVKPVRVTRATPKPPAQQVLPQPPLEVDGGKRKRGRPRKHPPAPPPKRKRVSKVMTAEEKELLSRVLAPLDQPAELMEEMDDGGMEREDGGVEAEEGNEMEALEMNEADKAKDGMEEGQGGKEREDEGPAPLEKQEPKAPEDVPAPSGVRRRAPWSWRQRLGKDATVNTEMGGRLCNYCLKHQKRQVWIPNEAMALMDHARTHCVETLMCPSKDCTYMNTHRSRISQHVSYVHKKWGMPIDLADVYPSMRKSLMIRLRQCFPDVRGLSVCQMCRVAVRPDADEFRWHAQSHLTTRVFECSRNICTMKFTTEQECRDHIQRANCRGSVVNGMTDVMEAEVGVLVDRCFSRRGAVEGRRGPGRPPGKANKPRVIVLDEDGEGEALSATPAASTSKVTSQQEIEKEKRMEEKEEEEVWGKEDEEKMEEEKVEEEEEKEAEEEKMEEGADEMLKTCASQ